jgi:hypothetical protein
MFHTATKTAEPDIIGGSSMPEATARPDVIMQILKIARFAIICTLAFAGVLLVTTLTNNRFIFLTENILLAFIFVIGLELIAAIVGATLLALWKKPE